MVGQTPAAYLHVGAPKTGSTYLQNLLWANHAALKEGGLHVVGGSLGDHGRASRDIRNKHRNPRDPRPDWAGSWSLLADLMNRSESPLVMVTDEHLAALSRGRRLQLRSESVASREVHIVYVMRSSRDGDDLHLAGKCEARNPTANERLGRACACRSQTSSPPLLAGPRRCGGRGSLVDSPAG